MKLQIPLIAAILIAMPNAAYACGGTGEQVFFEQPVRILPARAVQVRIDLLDRDGSEREYEVRGKIVEVVDGDLPTLVPGRIVYLDLRLGPSSCEWIGEPGSEKFVVARPGLEQRAGRIVLSLSPLLYSQRRSVEDERQSADYYNDHQP